jgi:hypothetical protein
MTAKPLFHAPLFLAVVIVVAMLAVVARHCSGSAP